MPYSYQTFSIGDIFDAPEANALEVSIRDHIHGLDSVSGLLTIHGFVSAAGSLMYLVGSTAWVTTTRNSIGRYELIYSLPVSDRDPSFTTDYLAVHSEQIIAAHQYNEGVNFYNNWITNSNGSIYSTNSGYIDSDFFFTTEVKYPEAI